MFISSKEKSIINARIDLLESQVNSLVSMLALAEAKLSKTPKEEKLMSRKWSDQHRAAASVRMKKYWADKKTSKATS